MAMNITLPYEAILALYNFWYKYHNDTGCYDGGDLNYKWIKNSDVVELDGLSDNIEDYENEIRTELGL